MNNSEKRAIDEAFGLFELSLDDLRKLLEADYSGPSANFLIAEASLSIAEPITKVYFPYVRRRQVGYVVASSFDDISAKDASYNFFQDCFSDNRYSNLSNTIWDSFRNGHVHLFQPKKVINVPFPQFDNSFLTGVHLSGVRPSEITQNPTELNKQRAEHLEFFTVTNKKGQKRPVFRFSPLIYFLDLVEAVSNFKDKVLKDPAIRQRFIDWYELLVQAKRLDFSGQRIPQVEKDLLINKLRNL